MTAKTELSAPKRRTRAEVQQLVDEFVSSGMRRSEFCQSRGLSFSTLDRHLKKRRWKKRRKLISSAGRLVPVDLAAKKSLTQQEPRCGLAVVLPDGRVPISGLPTYQDLREGSLRAFLGRGACLNRGGRGRHSLKQRTPLVFIDTTPRMPDRQKYRRPQPMRSDSGAALTAE